MEKEKLLRYSMELSMLNILRKENLITDDEYEKIKKKIMRDYKIVSDITG